MFANMKTKSGGVRLLGISENGFASKRCDEPASSHVMHSRLQRIAGGLVEEAWLPMGLKSLIVEELLAGDQEAQSLAESAQAVLSAARDFGIAVSRSNVLLETEQLSQELTS